MKNINLISIIVAFTLSCKAQTVPLETSYYDVVPGAYFKDTLNQMDSFVGTWQYTNGNTTLIIVLQKKEHVYDGEFYEDLLVGEYKYIENGIEIINTLPLLSGIDAQQQNIVGNLTISKDRFLACQDCAINERRFLLSFKDPERDYLPTKIVLRYLLAQSNPDKMKILIYGEMVILPDENSPSETRVPYGVYLMEKQ